MITPAASGPAGFRPTTPARSRPGAAKAKGIPWGWLEIMVISQTAIPALLFLPGMDRLRFVTRVGYYGLVLLAWGAISLRGRSRPGGASYPPRPWLIFCFGYLALSLFHPQTNSLASGLAQIVLNVVIFSPIFWAADVLISPRQIPRLMAIAFIGNALSAGVGIGQIYQPGRFNPPKMASTHGFEETFKMTTDAGVEVIRPSGLTDSPGAAGVAGQFATIIGLCWALAPIAHWKRLASVALAVTGLAVVYFSQVRSALIITVLSLIAIVVILSLQRDFKRAFLLGAGGSVIVLGAFTWAMAVMGGAVGSRVATLFADDPGKVFHSNRGRFVEETMEGALPQYPLGAGLGRWGMMYAYFGDQAAPPDRAPLWAEVQITGWVYDGGAPVLIAYFTATILAIADSLRIALRCKDPDLAFWAASITACNFGILTLILSYPVFVSPGGLQFWLISVALHAADRRVRTASAGPPRRLAAT